MANPKADSDAAGSLLLAAQAGAEPAFSEFLATHKHRPDLPAPAGLRKLLLGGRVLRIELDLAYQNSQGKESLVWWLGELGFEGSPEAAAGRLKAALEAEGLTGSREGDRSVYASPGGPVSRRVEFEGPRSWTGGRGPACSVRLAWIVEVAAKAPPTLERLLKALPFLKDDRVDAALVEGLSGYAAARASVGGTWTQYYTWDVNLKAAKATAGPELRGEVKALLEKAGFSLDGAEKGYERYARKATGSFALLYDPDASGGVRLSIQPRS